MEKFEIISDYTVEGLVDKLNRLPQNSPFSVCGYAYSPGAGKYSALVIYSQKGSASLEAWPEEISFPERSEMEKNTLLYLIQLLGDKKSAIEQLGLTTQEAKELLR